LLIPKLFDRTSSRLSGFKNAKKMALKIDARFGPYRITTCHKAFKARKFDDEYSSGQMT
jgi:hypothetical protein